MELLVDFMGQRPGLRDLPPIPVTELTGEEFGQGLSQLEIRGHGNSGRKFGEEIRGHNI